MRRRRAMEALAAFVIFLVVADLVSPFVQRHPAAALDKALATSDFAAFYCASLAARSGADPYKTASLESCQRERAYRPGGITFEANGVNPAPLPGYDFAFFAPLTYLPYRAAGVLWIAILLAANLATARLLQLLTRIPLGIVVAALAVTDGAICYQFGQQQPIVTLVLAGAALLLRQGRPRSAATLASLTLVEPHVGLPVVLALFFWTPARATVAFFAAAFAALSVAFIGVAANVEYFTAVLPVHAFAEVGVWFQYSLTSVLYTLGLPAALSLRIASLQYGLAVVLAVVLAGPVARRAGAPALVLFPAACAVVGGPFIHIQQIASAIPFALYLAACVPGFTVGGWIAVVLLGLQWPATSRLTEATGAILVFGAVSLAFAASPPARRLAVGSAALVLYFAMDYGLWSAPYANVRPLPSAATVAAATARYDPSLASTRWAIALRGDAARSEMSLRRDLDRLPAWIALAIVLFAGIALRRPVPVTT